MTLLEFEDLQERIKETIAHGDLNEAFELMLQHFKNSPEYDDLILQSGSFTSLQKQQRTGIVNPALYSQQYSQLGNGLLGTLKSEHKRIKRQNVNEIKAYTPNKDLEEDYKLALARVSILWVFQTGAGENNSYTTTEIYKLSKLENRKYIAAAIKEMEQAEWLQKSTNEKGVVFSLIEKGGKVVAKCAKSALFQPKADR